jgi:hypothetical protein
MSIQTIARITAISSLLMLGTANAMTADQDIQLDLSMGTTNPFSSQADKLASDFFGYDDSADRVQDKVPALVTPGVDHTFNRRTEIVRIGVL